MTDLQAAFTENADLRAAIAVLEAEVAALLAERKATPRNYTVVMWSCDDDGSGVQFIGQCASFSEAYALARGFDAYSEDEYPTPEFDGDEWQGWIGSTMYAIKAYPAA